MKTQFFKKRIFLLSALLSGKLLLAAPGNDACAGATALTPVTNGATTNGQDLYQATNSGPASSIGATYDVWYKFTVPANTNTVTITINGLGSSLNGNNAFIEAFNAAACAGISTATIVGNASVNTGLTMGNVVSGGVYYFRIFTTTNPASGAGTWGFNICVGYTSGAPGNDNCTGAVTLTPGTTNASGSVANATASSGIPAGCATGTPDDDVWYKFTATRSYATVAVKAGSTLYRSGAMIQVFSGNCGALVSIGCDKDAANLTGLVVGQLYFIRIYSFGGATGAGVIGGDASPNGASFNIAVTPGVTTIVTSSRMNEVYGQTNLSTDNIVSDPWEITYGPDDFLWITEAKGYRVFRMDPATGARTTVLDVSKLSTFLPVADTSFDMRFEIDVNNPQGGFAGLAIHPQFMAPSSPQNYVYVSYVHTFKTTLSGNNGSFYTNRLVRFTYNTSTGKLESPVALCDTIPGSSDHNSQRLIIAPVGGTDYLFYAQGDMGAGQFANQYRAQRAQDSTVYEGKILRFNLVSDGDAGLLDRWIPNDNPYNATVGKQSAIWAIGIRNNQGFAYDSANDILYGASHGPYSDDEINVIEKYKNYGHPLVIGYAADNNYNNSSAGAANTTSSCPVITSETANANTINASGYAPYKDPIYSAYAPSQAAVRNMWLTNPNNGGWPSEAWSGLDFYAHTLVPGWKNSLIACSLKWGRLVRMKLNAAGTRMVQTNGFDSVSYFGGQNRFRDLAFAPNGKDIYVVMDRSTTSSGPSNANPVVPSCAGCIQRFSFIGYADASGKSSIPDSIPVTSGTPNACTAGTTVTINAANNMYWVPITGPDGNIMAEIYPNGNNLGTVTSSFYTNSGSIRIQGSGNVRLLDRNITITPQTQPSTPVKIRLYITKAEYDALDADPASGISAITDLKILKNSDACGNIMLAPSTAITPTFALAQSNKGYVLQGSITGFSSFYFASTNISLPLPLLSFTATLENNCAALLKWITTNQTNADYFIVERSSDGVAFTDIGKVDATENGSRNVSYSFTDRDLIAITTNTAYYRLRQVDKAGLIKYSTVLSLPLPTHVEVMVSPNPVSSIARVQVTPSANGELQWKLIDVSGHVVLYSRINVQKNSMAAFVVNMSKLAGGTYYLHVTGAGTDKRIKLQKL